MKFIVKQREITKAIADFVHKRLGLKDEAPMTVQLAVNTERLSGKQEITATVTLNSDEFENS